MSLTDLSDSASISPSLSQYTTRGASARPLTAEAVLRICVVSDDLAGYADEGVKKFTVALAAELGARHEVTTISVTTESAIPGVRCVPSSRLFLGGQLRGELRRLRPDVVIYATRRSATFFSFVRSRVLRMFCPTATIVLFGLQTRYHSGWQRRVIRRLRPDLICVLSEANRDYLSELGCRVALLPSGVDTAIFQPASEERRRDLRREYGLDNDRPIVLHVGHLQAGRGIGVLGDLARRGHQVILVTSSSTHREEETAERLRASGVRIVSDYLPHIEHLYQLADVYVFPVESTDNAIEVPLSVLEALACDLPVVTTRFGGLPRMFPDATGESLSFVDGPDALIATAERVLASGGRGGRRLVDPFAWSSIAGSLLEQARVARHPDAGSNGPSQFAGSRNHGPH